MKSILSFLVLLTLVFSSAQSAEVLKFKEIANKAVHQKGDELNASIDSLKAIYLNSKNDTIKKQATLIALLQVIAEKSSGNEFKSVDGSITRAVSKEFKELPKELQKGFKTEKQSFYEGEYIYTKKAYDYPVYPIITVSNGKAILVFKMRYSGQDWIFFDEVMMKTGKKYFTIKTENPNRKVISGNKVTETDAVTVKQDLLDFLNIIAENSDPVEYLFLGKGTKSGVYKEDYNQMIKQVLAIYYAL